MSDERDGEAQKCIDVAKRAMSEGDLLKSQKFLKKSLAFTHTVAAEKLLAKVEEELTSSAPSSSVPRSRPAAPSSPPPQPAAAPTSSSSSAAATNGRPAASSSSATAADLPKKSYTPEEQTAARRVNKQIDYYEILGVQREATELEIKGAYRKMALKFHPDKNHAPEAEEAFKKVSEAYTCLSDANEREYYNQHGKGGPRGGGGAAREAYAHAHHGFRHGGPMTPEELFNMFFEGQNVRRAHFRAQQPREQGGQQEQRSPLMNIAHFLPLILLFLFSFLGNSGSDEPLFSLDKTADLGIRRVTPSPASSVYWVGPNFARRYARDYRALATVEAQVDQQTFKKLEDECAVQKKAQKQALADAKKANTADRPAMLQKAHDMELKSCERLQEVRGR